jgi:hypothetical protein
MTAKIMAEGLMEKGINSKLIDYLLNFKNQRKIMGSCLASLSLAADGSHFSTCCISDLNWRLLMFALNLNFD